MAAGKWVEFDYFDFEDANGVIRTIHQCSFKAQSELRQRLNELFDQLNHSPHRISLDVPHDELVALSKVACQLLAVDRRFAFLVKRCLNLCHLELDWLNPIMLTMFLFPHTTPEGQRDALLCELNNLRPRPAETRHSEEKGLTYEGLVALLLDYSKTLDKAKELADTVPAGQLIRMIEERNELMHQTRLKTDKKYAEEYWRKKSQERATDELTRLRNQMYGPQP